MAVVMIMSVVLIAMLCVAAYTLAVYALPFMLGLTAAQFAYQTGSGFLGAGVALFVAAPAAFGGYALVHGVTKESVPSEIWRQIFCIIGGGFVGISALLRLAAPSASGPTPVR